MNGEKAYESPEEAELSEKQAELGALEEDLARAEMELVTIRAQLRAFENRYLRVVGSRYAELDRIDAEVAELRAANRGPGDGWHDRAAEARARAEESARAMGEAEKDVAASVDFRPSHKLKTLYRQIAKLLHPDLSTDPKERERRHRLMAEVNDAYAAGDEARLEEVLRDWRLSPEAVEGEGIQAELVRAIRKIAQVKNRIRAVTDEIRTWRQSELSALREKAIQAQKQHRDLLAEMARELDGQIAQARTRLHQIAPSGGL